MADKDDVEKRLEALLFGDDSGFHAAVQTHHHGAPPAAVVVRDDGRGGQPAAQPDMEDVDDAELFFLDAGDGDAPSQPSTPPDSGDNGLLGGEQTPDTDDDASPAVWHDSDDDRLTVSLAGQARLRKLRRAESEDLISGKEYIRRLRSQFRRLHPLPGWADPACGRASAASSDAMDTDDDAGDGDGDGDDDDTELSAQPLARLLQTTADLTLAAPDGRRAKLRQEVLDIQRLKDVGRDQPSSIDSLSFHPRYPVLLSSGPAATLSLHHVSPSAPAANPLLTSLHIRRTPIHTSAFAPPAPAAAAAAAGSNKVVASGRRRYFHVWDLDTGKVDKVNGTADRKTELKSMERFKLSPCGRFIAFVGSARKGGGLVNILAADSAHWVAQVRVDGRGGVADLAWWSNGQGLLVASKNGELSEYDLHLRRVVARWLDHGAVGTTVVALGGTALGGTALGGDRWVAVGSSSGIVNIYDRRDWLGAAAAAAAAESTQINVPRQPKPARVLDQLTTPISHLVFSPDGQLLAMASRWKRDAMKLVHLPSCTVYRNWPTASTPLGRISSVAISPNSRLLAVGNEQGRIRLWDIRG